MNLINSTTLSIYKSFVSIKIYLLLSAITITLTVSAQESIPYNNDFEGYNSEAEFLTEWTSLSTSPGVWYFDETGYLGNGGSNAPWYFTSSTVVGDDWLFSPAVSLESGTTYNLKFLFSEYIVADKMSVHLNTDVTSTSTVSTIVDLGEFTNSEFNLSETNFTAPASGTYYIGFYVYSNPANAGIVIDDFSIDFATNIDVNEYKTINVYPNPSTGYVNISNAENSSILVYNIIGEEVKKITNVNTTSLIDLSSCKEGNYVLKIIKDKQIISKKITLIK